MEIGFLIKKLFGVIISPLPFFFVLGLVSIYYFRCNKTRIAGRLAVGAFSLLVLFSLPITSQFLIRPLEFQTPKLNIENETYLKSLDVSHILVLGCWHSDDPLLPLVAKIHQCSLPRIIQGIQIWRKIPNATLVFSGFSGKNGKQSDPEINAQLALELGVPKENILILEGTRDSEDEIVKYASLPNLVNYIVISSATHMPRLKILFEQQGLTPILSPAEYVSGHGDFSWQLFIPQSYALHQSERAIYEVMGNIWVRLKSLFVH